MLLGHVVKLDPLAMFLNCLGESSLSYTTQSEKQAESPRQAACTARRQMLALWRESLQHITTQGRGL